MKLLTIVFSNHCNLDCTYCCVQSKNLSPNLSVDDAKAFIDKYFEDGCIIEFYGGEPFANIVQVNELYSYIKEEKYNDRECHIRIFTSGIGLPEHFMGDVYSGVITTSKFDEILISLDGFTYKENSQRFKTEEEFNIVMNSVKKYVELDSNVGISTVLFGKEKFENMFDNYLKFRELGVNYFSYEPLTIYNDTKPVVIPKEFMKIMVRQLYKIIEHSILYHADNTELFVAKELLSSNWFNRGEITQCSKMVRAISPRGNIYMCRDHAANEEELFYSPKVIQFLNKNNFKTTDETFPVIESNENNLTPCPVKNIQYRDAGIDTKLYWLEDEWQTLIMRPIYKSILAVNKGHSDLYREVLAIAGYTTDKLLDTL